MHVIRRTQRLAYILGLFRHFSEFDNHKESPLNVIDLCLLSAVADSTCTRNSKRVNKPFTVGRLGRGM